MSDKKFDPKNQSIGEIFTPPAAREGEDVIQHQYIIPQYQRGYDWNSTETEDFIKDIIDSKANKEKLFLGTMIFCTEDVEKYQISKKNEALDEDDHAHFQKVEIVDGQQRLTSIFLLLIVCREIAKTMEDSKTRVILPQSINEILYFHNNIDKILFDDLRFLQTGNIAKVFKYIADESWNGKFVPKAPEGKSVEKLLDDDSFKDANNKIKKIYNVFNNQIKKEMENMTAQEKSIFIKGLFDTIVRAEVITIEIKEKDEAFNIFERNNARGLELETSDLLKNYLFSTAKLTGLTPEIIHTQWKTIVENSGGNVVRMIRYFYISHEEFVRKNALYKRLKKYATENNANNFLTDLKSFSKFYNEILTGNEDQIKQLFKDKEIDKIFKYEEKYKAIHRHVQGLRLFDTVMVIPLLYAAVECFRNHPTKSASNLVKLFHQLEKFHFITSAICSGPTNDIEKKFAYFCKEYNDKKIDPKKRFTTVTDELTEYLKTETENKREAFIAEFSTKINYNNDKAMIAYVFDRFYNYESYEKELETYDFYNDEPGIKRPSFNIEHWHPQSIPLVDDVQDNIGNLILMSWKTNSMLDGKSPAEKYLALKGPMKVHIEHAYSKPLNKFFDEYEKQTDNFKNWGQEEIEGRAKDLAKEAFQKIWKID